MALTHNEMQQHRTLYHTGTRVVTEADPLAGGTTELEVALLNAKRRMPGASLLIRSHRQHSPTKQQNSNTLSSIESKVLVREFKVRVFFKQNAHLDCDEINFGTESEARYTFYIAEEKLQECPRTTIKLGEEVVSAILDTGSELLKLMNENLYETIKQRGNKYLELPAQHLTLIGTFKDKSRRVKREIFVQVKLESVFIDHVFLVSPQLLTAAILGVHFFIIFPRS
jgi:hypothetical protein